VNAGRLGRRGTTGRPRRSVTRETHCDQRAFRSHFARRRIASFASAARVAPAAPPAHVFRSAAAPGVPIPSTASTARINRSRAGVVYGVIFRHATRAVPAAEVEKVEPVGK
jgi:hypothetical protein